MRAASRLHFSRSAATASAASCPPRLPLAGASTGSMLWRRAAALAALRRDADDDVGGSDDRGGE